MKKFIAIDTPWAELPWPYSVGEGFLHRARSAAGHKMLALAIFNEIMVGLRDSSLVQVRERFIV